MLLPRLGRLRNNRNAWWQSLGKIGVVNYPSRVVNCSSKSGELCKRIEAGTSFKEQHVTSLIQRTLRAEDYPKISKNLIYSPLLARFTGLTVKRLAQFTSTGFWKPSQISLQRKRT